MCGRFTLRKSYEIMAAYFQAAGILTFTPRFNIAPTQLVPAAHGERQWAAFRWGLVPHWSKEPKVAFSNINARSETVATSPAFRSAFKHRRCLLSADGFYEWSGEKGHKRATFFHLRDDQPFAFAGLFEHWERDGQALDTYALITTEANAVVKPVHGRKPIMLVREDFPAWLEAAELPGAFPAEKMEALAVGPRVNNARNEELGCLDLDPERASR